MNPDIRDILRRLLWHLCAALPVAGLGIWLMCGGLGTAFYGAALIIIGGCIAAFPLGELLGHPLSSLFFPTESGPPPPCYSIPEARVKQGRFTEAMAEYAAIITKYPQETRAYTEMIEVAFKHLHDRDWANSIYRQGMQALHTEEQRAVLHQMYSAYRSLDEPPTR